MALGPVKTWVADEILFASDLVAEFANVYNNGENLATPATKAHDMNGFELTMDAAGGSGFISDTTNRIDVKLQGVDLFRFDGTTATSVNGLTFTASDTGNDVVVVAQGSDSNIDVDIQPKGTGVVLLNSIDPYAAPDGIVLATQIFSF